MKTFWFISDTHFFDRNILTFLRKDGSLLRSGFNSIEEMNELIVENWNKVVKPEDRVYHLGDVAFSKKDLEILNRLNGSKILIKGNHDTLELKEYIKYFKDIRAYKVISELGFIFSHIPIHPDGLKGRLGYNIHGHLHEKIYSDKHYINISVEQTNYCPLSLEDLSKEVLRRENEIRSNS